jgi:hypothetical protein
VVVKPSRPYCRPELTKRNLEVLGESRRHFPGPNSGKHILRIETDAGSATSVAALINLTWRVAASS